MNKPGVIVTMIAGWIASAIIVISGCATTSHPPTAFERKMYSVQTNEVIQFKTNYVTVTSPTGEVSVQPEIAAKTNLVYSLHPNQVSQTILTETATGIGNLFGAGGIAGIAMSGLYGLWASIRNRKVNSALIQGIETAREVLASTPQGQQADAALVSWLKQHQREAGVIKTVSGLVNTTADSEAAREAAKFILEKVNKS